MVSDIMDISEIKKVDGFHKSNRGAKRESVIPSMAQFLQETHNGKAVKSNILIDGMSNLGFTKKDGKRLTIKSVNQAVRQFNSPSWRKRAATSGYQPNGYLIRIFVNEDNYYYWSDKDER